MKTTYRRDNTEARKKLLTLLGIALVGALLLLYPPLRGSITNIFYTQTPTAWNAGNTAGNTTSGFFGGFRNTQIIVEENKNLQEEILRMQAQVLDRNLLAEKVAQLEERLGRVESDNRVSASVLLGPGRISYDTLVIDAGSAQGIELGDSVVYGGAGVIGRVAEIYGSSAKVKLHSSPKEESFVVMGKQALPARALGKGMGNFEALVPQGSPIVQGDEVTLQGMRLLLGIVQVVEEKPDQPFSRILFRSPFNIASITTVEVIVRDKKI